MVTGNPLFDAIGSIGIGVLLIVISLFLGIKIKGLLIGQSVDPEVSQEITTFLEGQPEINKVLNLITLQLGAQIMVAVKVKMAKVETVDQLIGNINSCEAALKKQNPAIQWVFFEPDVE
jgi:divalent metal cation (Fe/Co/Zn/Cd) transporter